MTKAQKNTKEEKPTIFIELADQRDSGFRLQIGGNRFSEEGKLTAPAAEFIPNRGFRKFKDEKTGEWYNQEIRYIKNQRVISVEEQNLRGIKPSRAKLEDKIIIKNGNFSVTREGAFVGLYDFIKDVYYNGANKEHAPGAKILFFERDITKKEELFNEDEVAYSDAIQYIKKLYRKQGDKFIYDEDKIDALANMFQVFAESTAGKITGLIAWAKNQPERFLQMALKFDDIVTTNITMALELSVFKFEGNAAIYVSKENKVIADLGPGNLKHETKIAKLAAIFENSEYDAIYKEFVVELKTAQENKLNN